MKKLLCGLLCTTLIGMTASAAVVDFQIDRAAYQLLDGETVTDKTLEAAPFVNDQWRTMVPVRAISEALGADVDWDGIRREVSVRQNETEILLYIDSTTALVNGAETALDCAPVIIEGRTFVPLRFVGEVLAYNVNYTPVSRHVVIDNTKPVLVCPNASFSFAELETLYRMFLEANQALATQLGMQEAELSKACMDLAIDTATDAVLLKNAYADVSLSPEVLGQILYSAETENLSVPLTGLRDVLYEKLYHASGYAAFAHLEQTVNPESTYTENYVCAKHILVEDEETAKAVYARAVAGEDFDALIAEYNTDPGMEANPNGYVFTKGEMVPSFEEAAFAAAVDSITEPVQSVYGYHIIRRLALPPLTEEQSATVLSKILNQELAAKDYPQQLIDTATLYAMVGIAGEE
ncbi:MAG: hypothetical protein E7408_01415 [Ruminococcaceae bacterium]|nr:hypothetical protein [Oscillospiraceae bacterium]